MSLASDFPKTFDVYTKGQDRGLHLGMQIYASRKGETILDEAVGFSDKIGRELKHDDLMLWMSASKPIGAIAIAQLMESGHLTYDELVADTISEFGQLGKGPVTIRHLLTHTSGFPNVPMPMARDHWNDIIMTICDTPLEEGWVVGESAGYHPHSSWYILAEILQRKLGVSFSSYVRDRIFLSLEMENCWIGMTPEAWSAYEGRIAPTFNTFRSASDNLKFHAEGSVTACIPGGNGRGPMRELAILYETLLNEGIGNTHRILKTETIDDMTHRHRTDQCDTTFGHKIDWGLGFIPNSNKYGAQTVPYGYGLHSSDEAYGHGGSQSVGSMADPAHDLVVCVAFNGMPGEPQHNLRIKKLMTALYEDLLID